MNFYDTEKTPHRPCIYINPQFFILSSFSILCTNIGYFSKLTTFKTQKSMKVSPIDFFYSMIIINCWLQDPASYTYTSSPLATINVNPNRRIRFRMINSLSWTCPVQVTIQSHELTIISTDGENVNPKTVNTITSFSGNYT